MGGLNQLSDLFRKKRQKSKNKNKKVGRQKPLKNKKPTTQKGLKNIRKKKDKLKEGLGEKLQLDLKAQSCEPLNPLPPNSTDSLGALLQGRVGTPFQPPFLSCPWVRVTAATTCSDCPGGQSDFLAPPCLSHLAEHHPAISASEPHTVATPNPESLQPFGPERCPIPEMPFHLQTLQNVSHVSQLFFSPSLPPTPSAFSSSTSFY